MLLEQKTRTQIVALRGPSSEAARRFPIDATRLFSAVVFALVAGTFSGAAVVAQDALRDYSRGQASDYSTFNDAASYGYAPASRSTLPPDPRVRDEDVAGESIQFEAVEPRVQNERCVQRTFRAPEDKNAALVGTFLRAMLPDNLRSQTMWRFNEEKNTLTIYGPEKAIELSEKLLDDFSEPLFKAFLTSNDYASMTGIASETPRFAKAAPVRENRPTLRYYDPAQNERVKVAFDPEGAVVPDRREYVTAFGGGDTPNYAPSREPERAASVWASPAETREARVDADSILDVASYRCLPTAITRIEPIVRRQFGNDPSIALSFDRSTGLIVVHTNRKLQREVGEFLAALQIYPDSRSDADPDPRLATGTLTSIDGSENPEETVAARSIRQAFTGGRTSAVSGAFADQVSNSFIEDVYRPQYRKTEELQDSLLQLFGERLQRKVANASARSDERRQATYRFVKRQRPEDQEIQTCEITIDAANNHVELVGSSTLCAQMLTLLRAMDQPPLGNGNVRRFVPIRNGDSRKLRQIFECDSAKSARAPRGRFDRFALEENSESDDFVARFSRYFSEVATDADQTALASAGLVSRSVGQTMRDAISTTEYLARTEAPKSFGTRQVSYQEDGGTSAAASDGDYQDERRGLGGGIGVVQDFTPTILPDIDVVIIDNATNAEYERIKQMIEQIEELAKIADAQTEIYRLKHVDCAMLHGVLTTLYEEMFTTKQGRVVFYALQNPNALLVAGWGQAFKDMKDLIELFDQPILDETSSIRVVQLKYASADEIAALLTETFVTPQTTGTGGFAPRIRVFSDVRTNSLVVHASPNDWSEVQKILLELDVNKASTRLTQRVFPLKNSLAENIRTTIVNAILPAKQGTLDTSAAKFPVLELLSVDESGRRLVESGIMMDVDVVADVYHNQLIVTAPEDCMEFMERLIELLDVAPKKAQIRFFQVKHGDASQIIKTLQSLLATSDENLSTPTIPQAEGEETFVPARFALDTRTNVIIAAAAPKELAIIDALIVALDVKDATVREEVVVKLRNIQALVVAQAIDDYLSQKQTLETTSEVLSNYQLLENHVIVIPESISNSIIVSASPDEMINILRMIQTFDKDPYQVVIQVLIAEVTLSNQEEFGIEAGLQDSVSFDRSMITETNSGKTGDPGYNIVHGSGPGKNLNDSGDVRNVAGQVLNNFAMGASNSTLGYGGFVLSASSRSIDITLRALREKNRLQVLSRPQVTAMDNQQAFILVGQRVPRISGTTTTNYGVQMNTTDTPVGLILLVTPRVTMDGKVVMEIGAEKSNLGNDSDATPIFSQDGAVIKSKSIDTIQAMTAISARDGETVMIGGLLTSSKEKISRGVPYVSDIPLLGWLFRYDQEVETRKELLIVMTPRIMRSSEDYAETLRIEMNRTSTNLNDAMAINGNMGLYDPRTNSGYETKRTKRLVDQLVHMDKMDELQNKPGYEPCDDYRPRPNEPLEENNPYDRLKKRDENDANLGAPNGDYDSDPNGSYNEEFDSDERFDLAPDDFASRGSRREATTRVALRDSDVQRGATRIDESRGTRSTKRSENSSSRVNRAENLSDARTTRAEAERFDAVDTAIRGQETTADSILFEGLRFKLFPNELERPGLSNGNKALKLFHWFDPE